MKLLIGGDLVINNNYSLNKIDSSVLNLFESSDFNILNLESPVTESEKRILKTGPHLKADSISTKKVLKALNINLVTLANNHILDYGEVGLKDTLKFCKDYGINVVGAGLNIKKASKMFLIKNNDHKIAIVNFAENEWSNAKENSAGANPMDDIKNFYEIQEAKKLSDFVIVIVHGGHEYNNLPSPRMKKQYRFYAEVGADLVVGHHTHCVSGNEIFNKTPIYYSLGNFLFTSDSNMEDWYTGLVLEVDIKDEKLNCRLHPIFQEKKDFKLQLEVNSNKQSTLDRISSLNKIILDDIKLNIEWNKYIEYKYQTYLFYWSPLNFLKIPFIKTFFKKFNISVVNKKGIPLLFNLIRCEAHLDLSKEIMYKYLGKNE